MSVPRGNVEEEIGIESRITYWIELVKHDSGAGIRDRGVLYG